MLCPKSASFHKYRCIKGKCENCQDVPVTIKTHYRDLLNLNPQVSWNHWERKTCEDGRIRRVMVTHRGTIKELMNELIHDVIKPTVGVTFMEHKFVAEWQYEQFRQLKQNLPSGWVLLVMDFAIEMYTTKIKSSPPFLVRDK